MLLPLRASPLIDHPAASPSGNGPMGVRDCVGAALLFVLAVATTLVLLGLDWHGLLSEGDRPLPESSRMMVIPPQPR